MPQTEEEVKDDHISDSPKKTPTLWQKFHFSGRVIMCSVLFGMGLVLIGGLIFAINVDDDTGKNEKIDDTAVELPTKAPSNYVGPVVMGIGGFIVVVGVIMCLFETQVCRKKTGDTKPLISDKDEGVEVKVSESSPIPSSSHCHKNHKHKIRKASSSPRKTKGKHTKSHSHEQKQASSKSPPISIDKSKSFMTSSEENFLTPPNTLGEHADLEHRNSREAEIQTSSSLMKSFTSSGTWNQSTEFLTPTASYKENSESVDNSVELDEKQGQVNFAANEISALECTQPEYMTPLTKEEERIQEMLNQVKKEQMNSGLEQSEVKEAAEANLSSRHGNDSSAINDEKEIGNNDNVKIAINDQSSDVHFNTSSIKETTDKSKEAHFEATEKDKHVNEENAFSDNFSNASNVSAECFKDYKNDPDSESADIVQTHKNEKEDNTKNIPSLRNSTTEKTDSFHLHNSPTSHLGEDENILDTSNAKTTENNQELDLGSSSSSSEGTVVSQDSFIEKSKISDDQIILSMTEQNCSDKMKTSDSSESLEVDPSSNHNSSDYRNSQSDNLKTEKNGASDLNDKENNSLESKNTVEQSS